MIDLSKFLLARIAEDEAWARDSAGPLYGDGEPGTPGHSARVLAECDAKRRIVEEHTLIDRTDWPGPCCVNCVEHGSLSGLAPFPCPTLRFLALPYADHADYRDAWRP